jgi:hypothetical protein
MHKKIDAERLLLHEGHDPPLTEQFRPKQKTGVTKCPVNEELILLDRESEFVHQLNGTSAYIWERCNGQHSAAEIASHVSEAFDVDGLTALKDVLTLVERLHALRLLEDSTD